MNISDIKHVILKFTKAIPLTPDEETLLEQWRDRFEAGDPDVIAMCGDPDWLTGEDLPDMEAARNKVWAKVWAAIKG